MVEDNISSSLCTDMPMADLGDVAIEQIEDAKKTSSLQDEVSRLKSRIAYLQADFDNYKKRCQRDRESIVSSANESLASDIFSIVDSFEQAQDFFKTSVEAKASEQALSGISMIMDKLVGALEKHGFKKIDILIGSQFDVNLCEAVSSEESDLEKDAVVRIFSSGWMHNGKTVRPAKVAVAK